MAAAIVDSAGRLLAARRTSPPALAGGWELPGGKVEPGESPEDALRREIAEELGIDVRLGAAVPGQHPLAPGLVMRVWRAEIVRGEPAPLVDHDSLCWLPADDWESIDWLPGDLPAVRAAREVRG